MWKPKAYWLSVWDLRLVQSVVSQTLECCGGGNEWKDNPPCALGEDSPSDSLQGTAGVQVREHPLVLRKRLTLPPQH